MNELNLQNSVLNLESLEIKFKNKLIEYQNAYNSYTDSLKNTNTANSLQLFPNTYLFNSNTISRANINSADNCLALCSANPNCSSANYHSTLGTCNLYSGNNNHSVNDPSGKMTAIMRKKQNSLQNLVNMNNELMHMNNEINEKIQSQNSLVNQHYLKNAEENQNMIQTFQKLQSERDIIKKMMDELETIKEDNNDQRLRINQGVSKYVFWGIIALIMMFITIKVVVFPDADTNLIRYFFNTCIFILLFLWIMNLQSVTATFIILFLIIIIIASKFS